MAKEQKAESKAGSATGLKGIKGAYGTMYYVTDMAKSVEFFKARLSLKASFEDPNWTEFALAGHSLCLHLAGEKDKNTNPANGSLILHVDGIKNVVEDMRKQGVNVRKEVHEVHPGAWAAEFSDRDGNVIGLYEGPKAP